MVGYSYDKENKQRDYTYMAREKKSRNIVCGYVAIHKGNGYVLAVELFMIEMKTQPLE